MFFWMKPEEVKQDCRQPLYALPPMPLEAADNLRPQQQDSTVEIDFTIEEFCVKDLVHSIVYDV